MFKSASLAVTGEMGRCSEMQLVISIGVRFVEFAPWMERVWGFLLRLTTGIVETISETVGGRTIGGHQGAPALRLVHR